MKLFILRNIWIIILLLIIYYVINYDSEKMTESNMCTIDKVYYYMNVLSKEDFNKIYEECNNMNPEYMEDSMLAKRKILNVSEDSILYNVFYGEKFINFLNNKLNMKLKPSKLLPIDYRIYDLGGRMRWHRDVVISENKKCPQIEIVFTLENTSDSSTIWKDDNTQKINKIRTEPNSIIITQGNSSYHKVLPVTMGQRRIIKVAYEVI